MSSSRDLILQRIRSGLAGTASTTTDLQSVSGLSTSAAGATTTQSVVPGLSTSAAPPAVPQVWPRETTDAAALAERFGCELREVQGEILRCGSMDEARQKLAALVQEIQQDVLGVGATGGLPTSAFAPGATTNLRSVPGSPTSAFALGAMDKPLCRQVTDGFNSGRIVWAQPDWTPDFMSQLPASLVAAEYLLADTGSVVIACATHQERLLCYLPPVCIVIARSEQLHEHLPAAWEAMVGRCADPAARGELVIVTGPSRTADIEKILILGVHGPKRLVVILVG